MKKILISKFTNKICFRFSTATIVQSQYNFYVDFKGFMYFDDGTPFLYPNSIKDVKFITQFYKHLKPSNKPQYPFFGEFWGQRNYLRCAISPVIFNYIDSSGFLIFSVEQKSQFKPQKLELDSQGRIWHPFNDQIKGVFSNQLIANILQDVETRDGKTSFKHKGKLYQMAAKV